MAWLSQLVDHDEGGANIWGTGAILLYLAERYDTGHELSFASLAEKAEMVSRPPSSRMPLRACIGIVRAWSRLLKPANEPSLPLQTSWILYASTSLSVQQNALRLALSQLAEASATARGAITELRDIYGVYEARLAAGGGRDFLVGEGKGQFSLADIVRRGLPVNWYALS